MAIDGFLELIRDDDSAVEGEALDLKFPNAIAIESFEMKAEDSASKSKSKSKDGREGKDGKGSGRKSAGSKGKVKTPVSFKITKSVDSSSPAMYLSYCIHSDQEDANDKPFKVARV